VWNANCNSWASSSFSQFHQYKSRFMLITLGVNILTNLCFWNYHLPFDWLLLSHMVLEVHTLTFDWLMGGHMTGQALKWHRWSKQGKFAVWQWFLIISWDSNQKRLNTIWLQSVCTALKFKEESDELLRLGSRLDCYILCNSLVFYLCKSYLPDYRLLFRQLLIFVRKKKPPNEDEWCFLVGSFMSTTAFLRQLVILPWKLYFLVSFVLWKSLVHGQDFRKRTLGFDCCRFYFQPEGRLWPMCLC